MPAPAKSAAKRSYGFRQTASLLQGRLQSVGEARGFAVTKLLTHWADIVGAELAAICQPVKVSYAQRGMGATLLILAKPAHAPMLEMQLPQLRQKVNSCYGYNAIARVKLTQTAARGFAEGQAAFGHAPKEQATPPNPALRAQALSQADAVQDAGLREALADLGANILNKHKKEF